MLLTRRSAVGAFGLLACPPVSEPARISQKIDRPEPLWPPNGRMAPGGYRKDLRVGRWSATSVEHRIRRQPFAFVARDLDLALGNHRCGDIENDGSPAR